MDQRKDESSTPAGDKFDIHFQALCSAVEQEKIEKVRSILENQTHVNVNGVNGDGFTLLDLAFMTGNQSLLNLVVHHGGKEGAFFPSPEAVSAHLLSLIVESRKQVEKFSQLVKMTNSGGATLNTTLSQVQLKEGEKQLTLWQKRLNVLKKLKAGFDSSGCPHAPVEVLASVTGSNNIHIKVKEPEKFGNSLFTKFKIQWSHLDSFKEIAGEVEVKTIHTLEYNIKGLEEGKRYFIRASFGNPKGFGPYCASKPKSLVPSSWRNVDRKLPRIGDQSDTIFGLLDSLLKTRPAELSDYSIEEDLDQEDGKMRKKGLLGLFQSAPKFVKSPKTGVYLSCVMFHEDKVLLTNEDFLPLLEVQEDVPSSASLQSDFYWLMKMSYVWSDISKLRLDMSKSSTDTLRYRLLTAAVNMQSALGTENLGVLYYKPLRHPNGGVVFSLIHLVKSPKSLVSLSLKWAPLSRAQKHQSIEEAEGVLDMVRGSIREQILFYQVSNISISKGLHLCYLQSYSTIDSMSLVVSNTSPSILPYIKVRENPHVTAEEWTWIKNLNRSYSRQQDLYTSRSTQRSGRSLETSDHQMSPTTNFLVGEAEDDFIHDSGLPGPTESQYTFGKLLQQSVHRLFQYLEVSEQSKDDHRIYDTEIIELGNEISIILVLPPVDSVCSVNDTSMSIDINRDVMRDLMMVPLQSWEILQLATYFKKLLSLYAKLSSILEVDLALAKKLQREALSTTEAESAGHQVGGLLEYCQTLEESWTGVRWIREVLSNSRLKNTRSGISIQALTDWYINQPDTPDDSLFISGNNSSIEATNMNLRQPIYRMEPPAVGSWNLRGYRPPEGLPADAYRPPSGGAGSGLSRTPTTRSDPQELQHAMMDLDNKDNNNLNNLAHVRSRLLADGMTDNLYAGTQYSNSTNSVDSNNENEYGTSQQQMVHRMAPPESNILQVYAAYETGLAHGTSVRIKVSTATTAREVVDLVIKQLNMAVILKGKDRPIYENEKLNNFCLVAVIGSRERCLRDDFKPLNLQNPWKKGRLFVRMKHDLLAAIEHLSKHTTLI